MAVDLTGGIDPAREFVFAQRPDDPEMRDSVSFWVVDDHGDVGLPRIGIEAVAANWDAHDIQVNVAFPDGRVYRLRTNGPSLPAQDSNGEPTVLGAGGLVFRCVEPFNTWTMTYDGQAVQTSSADLVAGRTDGPLVDISFRMSRRRWPSRRGCRARLQTDAALQLKTSIEGDIMGGPRYEQLFRATGLGYRRRREPGRSPAADCGFAGRACVSSPASGGTAGNRRSSPADAHSATSPTRRDPTGSRPSTRAIVFTGDGELIPRAR